MQDVKRIESYGLYDFCQDLEAAFKEGYAFDFDTNENFPTAYGTMFTCGLVKAGKNVAKTEVKEEVVTETKDTVTDTAQTDEVVQDTVQVTETTEVKEPAKRGPKPKNK